MTTPVAKKEHICSKCGKPIKKGEKYFNMAILNKGKMSNRKYHYSCHESLDEINRSTFKNEEEFKESVHKGTAMMLETFSFQENMEISYVPLIITELAWHYADKALQKAASYMISSTKKLSRACKELRKSYLKEVSKDIDMSHQSKFMNETKKLIEVCQYDLTILWYSINQHLKTNHYELPYLDLRTDAYLSAAMVGMLKEHNEKVSKMVGDRIGDYRDFTNPKTLALKDCMEAFVSPAEVEITSHIKTGMEIMKKNMKLIEFNMV